jgi:hypothetical protein
MTTDIVDDRDRALEIGYKATDWPDPIDYSEYLGIAASWQVELVVRDGEPIGAVFRKDGETHVSILPEWRRKWLSPGLLKKLLAGTRLTSVEKGHEFMYGILERLGFQRQPDGTLTREI